MIEDVLQTVRSSPNVRFVVFYDRSSELVVLLHELSEYYPAQLNLTDPQQSSQTMKLFREGRIRVLLVHRINCTGYTLEPTQDFQVEVLFTTDPPSEVREQALARVHRPGFDRPKVVYVAIWNDRHADTTAHVFTDKVKAIDWARGKAKEFDRHGDYEEGLNSAMVAGKWVFYATYSGEGDSIWVVETEVDGELRG